MGQFVGTFSVQNGTETDEMLRVDECGIFSNTLFKRNFYEANFCYNCLFQCLILIINDDNNIIIIIPSYII